MTAVSEPPHALAGVTVLDLATYLAAPVCATLLGEFGADVIKVEQPKVGDDLRRLGRPVAASAGGSYWWFVEARNKKSITCNLRDSEGQALIRRLVASTHVVTENFRPGTLER
ncbi:MAG: CoA transferase, partial [Candidatus Rokuibacteriota bacterium]